MSNPPSSSKPNLDGKIILLQLALNPQSQPTFSQRHPNLTSRLDLSDPDLFYPVTTLSEAYAVFSLKDKDTEPAVVVLATDTALGEPKYKKLRESVKAWVGMGGEIFFIIPSYFGREIGSEDDKSKQNLETILSLLTSWKLLGRVIQGEFEINEDLQIKGLSWEKLSYRFEMSALCLSGVRDFEVVYRPCSWTTIEKEEGEEEEGGGGGDVAGIALTEYWDGRVGFVGDLGDTVEAADALRGIMLMR